MSIEFSTKVDGGEVNSTSISWYHDVSGSNRVLVVLVAFDNDAVANITATYDTVSMTAVVAGGVADGDDGTVWAFYLANPNTGNNQVVVDFNAVIHNTHGYSALFTGANTSDPIDNYNSAYHGSTGNPTVSVTTNNANSMLVDIYKHEENDLGSGPQETGQTALYDNDNGTWISGCSYRPTTTAQAYSMTWNGALDDSWCQIAFAINEGGEAYQRTLTDTTGITDTLTRIFGGIRLETDTVGVTDTVATIGSYVRVETDDVDITDTLTTAINYIKGLADTVGITDVVTTVVNKVVALADSVGITDTINALVTIVASIADDIGITDIISTTQTFVRDLSDTVDITDVLSLIGTYIRSIADTVGITDILTAIITIFVDLADTVGITDTITASVGFIRSLQDAVDITDVIIATKIIVVSITDTIGITDTISGTIVQVIFYIISGPLLLTTMVKTSTIRLINTLKGKLRL